MSAHGDLNGDGVTSSFVMRGALVNGEVKLAAELEATDPSE